MRQPFRTMLLVAVVHFGWHALLVFADPPPSMLPATPPDVILPNGPTPTPAPQPSPSSTLTLAADQLMVVRANAQGVLVAVSPDGLVKITTETGPIKVRAKFSDGDGTYQCRTFAEPTVFLIEPVTKGAGELLVMAPGGKLERRTLLVGGVPPIPPPGPGPTPPPVPADPLAATLQAAYTADADPAKAAHLVSLASLYKVAVASSAKATTVGDLRTSLDNATALLLPADGLPGVRKALTAELATAFGTDLAKPLDHAAATKELGRIANILGGLNP